MEVDPVENISPSKLAWQRFKKNKLAVLGVYILATAACIAILGGMIRPDATKNANSQQVALAKKGINFSVEMLKVRKNANVPNQWFFSQMFFGGKESRYINVPLHSYSFSGDSIVGFEYIYFKGRNPNHHIYNLQYT